MTVTLVPERRGHRGVLQADHARADDDGVPVQAIDPCDLVGVEDRLRPSRGTFGLCAGRDPQPIRMKSAARRRGSLRAPSTSSVCGSAKRAVPSRISIPLRFNCARTTSPCLLLDGLDAEAEVRDRELFLDDVVAAVEGAMPEPGEVEDPFAERLGRDRPALERDTAQRRGDPRRPPLADLGRRDRGLLAGRPRADDREVVLGMSPWRSTSAPRTSRSSSLSRRRADEEELREHPSLTLVRAGGDRRGVRRRS